MTVTCPRCTGKIDTIPGPALSRTDHRTLICSTCGRTEGLLALAGRPLPAPDQWPIRVDA